MELVHHGAVTGVTGSGHALRVDAASSVLVDCGLFQGDEQSGAGAAPHTLLLPAPRAPWSAEVRLAPGEPAAKAALQAALAEAMPGVGLVIGEAAARG
jgi:hypothetical protein